LWQRCVGYTTEHCEHYYIHILFNRYFLSALTLKVQEAEAPAETASPKVTKTKDEFDEILELAGSQGRFQKILVFAVLGPIIIAQPILTLNALFMLHEPDHFCFVPGRSNETNVEHWKNLTIPM
jgi:hypothetical protein